MTRATSFVHGTVTGYLRGCRCAACRVANTERHRVMRANRFARGVPVDSMHGTSNAYTHYGCRCVPCRQAQLDYERDLRRRKAEAAGSPS